MPLKPAEAYLPAYLKALNVNPASTHAAFYLANINLILTMLADVTVMPTTKGVPSLISAAPSSPVTGTGELK